MTVVSNSLLVRWLLALCHGIQALWHESALGGWFHRRRVGIQRAGQGSAVCQGLCREGVLTRQWSGTWFRRVTSAVFNFPATVFKWVYRKGQRVWSSSVIFERITGLGHAAWLFTGVFALVMMVVPHDAWDNLYAFLGAAALFFLYSLGCCNRSASLETTRLGPYFSIYALFITLGLVTSLDTSLSLRFYLFHLTCFFLVLLVVSAVDRVEQLRALLICAALGLTVAAIYGCYQGYVGVEVVASQQDLSLNEGMPGRIYSFFDNPNNFAEVLVMFLPLVAALTLTAKTWGGRLCGLFSLGVGVAAIGMTYGRACWMGLVLAMVVFVALLNWRFLPVMVVAGLCALPFLPESIWNRILTIGNMQDSSARYRIAIYEDTGRLLKDYGVTGVGLGSDVMKNVFKQYPTLYDGNYPIHTHNNYFQMWGEVGIFGLLAYLGLVLGQLKDGLKALRQADKRLRVILAAAIGSLTGILAVGLVEYTWFYPRNMFLFWLLIGVIAASVKLVKQDAAQR